MQAQHPRLFDLLCRMCGQAGCLRLIDNGHRGWSFTAVGFVGLAINRHNPPNSVIRCNACGSSLVAMSAPEADG